MCVCVPGESGIVVRLAKEKENFCVNTGPLVRLFVVRLLAQSWSLLSSCCVCVRGYEHTVVCGLMQDFGVRHHYPYIPLR